MCCEADEELRRWYLSRSAIFYKRDVSSASSGIDVDANNKLWARLRDHNAVR